MISKHPLYHTWRNMIRRCEHEHHPDYKNYGGRGISVCDDWRWNFEQFVEDMGPKPDCHYSIDRIDNDGNYEPNNIRWATCKEQNNNKRRPVFEPLQAA